MKYLVVLILSGFIASPIISQQSYHRGGVYNYLLYTPGEPPAGTGYPLLIFLHGSGERGEDPELLKTHGPPSFLDDTSGFPFMVVSPQCPSGKNWKARDLIRLLDEIEDLYAVDKDRIYITGLSSGGNATWNMAMKAPHRFAAIAPICGKINARRACKLRHLPVWVFHGALDNVHDHKHSDELVTALKACGGQVRYSLYPDVDHFAWVPAYRDAGLYKWFLQQRKSHE